MLGWFKKKFKKKEKDVPQEIQVVEDGIRDIEPEEIPLQPDDKELIIDSSTPSVEADIDEDTTSDKDETQVTVHEDHIPSGETASEDHPEPAIVDAQIIEKIEEAADSQPPHVQPAVEESPASDTEAQLEDEQIPEFDQSPMGEESIDDAPAVILAADRADDTPDDKTEPVAQDVEVSTSTKKKSLFSRLSEKLGKTKETFTYQLDALFLGKREISVDLLDDLEEILITADLGVSTSQELIEYARRRVTRNELSDVDSFKKALKKKIRRFILENDQDATLVMPKKGPFVIMVIGVNGVGKTTTIGKIANKFTQSGSSVLLAACDTFRAAAVAQLKIWGERNKVEVIAHKEGADPSSVAFDALEIAQSKGIDVVLVDTAGRMHTKENLMEELKKIKRVMGKKLSGAPHEVLLVIDATTGQNGISQAKLFDAAVDVSGIALTKLDGTSKGGIVVNISREMKIPIRFIGIGEQMDDLRDFDPNEFVDALFDSPGSTIS